MKSYIFLLILVIISCNSIEKQTKEDLILKDAIGDFVKQIVDVVNNCGVSLESLDCIGDQVVDVWNRLSDEQKKEMRNEGLGAVSLACGVALSANVLAGAICEVVCEALKFLP